MMYRYGIDVWCRCQESGGRRGENSQDDVRSRCSVRTG